MKLPVERMGTRHGARVKLTSRDAVRGSMADSTAQTPSPRSWPLRGRKGGQVVKGQSPLFTCSEAASARNPVLNEIRRNNEYGEGAKGDQRRRPSYLQRTLIKRVGYIKMKQCCYCFYDLERRQVYLISSEVRAVTAVSPVLKAEPAAELSPLLLGSLRARPNHSHFTGE